jgi:sugar lactone lactonase YvrE
LAAGWPAAVLGQADYATPYTFTTLTGNTGGSADGTGSAAGFTHPYGVAMDRAGNAYVADSGNNTIRKVTPAGVVTTLAGLAGLAGSADGTGSAARFASPLGVAVDTNGNAYVADSGNNTIRKVTPAGVVTTLAGLAGAPGSANGTNSAARFNNPASVAVGANGIVYVADTYNDTVRKVKPLGTNWVVTTLAGQAGVAGSTDGREGAAEFDNPWGVAVDDAGNVYVADTYNFTIRKVTPAGVVTNLAGLAGYSGTNNGTGRAARFNYPWGVAVDTQGNVYVADTYNFTIRQVTPAGRVTTLAGLAGSSGSADGTNTAARFYYPDGVAVDRAGNVGVADTWNNTIKNVTPVGTNWVVTTLAGPAPGAPSPFNNPLGVAVDSAGNVYAADSANNTILKVTPAGGVTTLAGLAGSPGSADGTNSAARFNGPDGVAVDTKGNVYVADWGNHTIRKLAPVGTDWVVTTLAGLAGHIGHQNGTNSAARFNFPNGVAVDTNGNVYVGDTANDTIRKLTPLGTNWVVTTLAGDAAIVDVNDNPVGGSNDGENGAARFYGPCSVAVDRAGNLYVADYYNSTIRKVTPVGTNWVVTTPAGAAGVHGGADGTNAAARFNYPWGVAVDTNGNVYVADTSNNTIRKVTPVGTNWVVTTLGGLPGSFASADGTGSAARFWDPFGVAVDSAGNVYVADTDNATIRKGFPASSVPAPNLQPPSLSAGQFGFGINGLPGLPVNLESSADLSRWQVVGACVLEGGTNFFVSPAQTQGAQFYRGQVR